MGIKTNALFYPVLGGRCLTGSTQTLNWGGGWGPGKKKKKKKLGSGSPLHLSAERAPDEKTRELSFFSMVP